MDARHVAAGVGSVTLVVLGLGSAVLLGEGSFSPAPHDKPAVIATARPGPPPAAYPAAPPEVADRMPEAPASSPAPAEPPPETDLPPTPKAPPLVEQAPPPAEPPTRRLEAAPPPAEPAPSPVLRTPPRGLHARHRLATAEPPAEQIPPPVKQAPSPVEPAPPLQPRPPVVDHRYDGVLTVAEISRLKRSLRLSPDQEPYWPQIAALLREVGRRQMAQVDAGRRPTFDLPGDLSSRLYSAAMPLLGTLREDQKEVVRRRAQMLGLGSVASFI